jgi:hypothetical protein
MRKPRYILKPGSLVEVTTRTLQGRLLMVPERTLNDIILGVLGRAQRLYPIQINAYCFVSSHYLCGASHKKCYGECPVMRSWPPRPNGCAGDGGGFCA